MVGVKQKRQNGSKSVELRFTDGSMTQTDPLTPGKPGPRKPRLLDPVALSEHVKAHPDQTLNERARHFGVSPACVGYGLKRLGYTRKKKRLDIRSNVQKNDKPIRSNSQGQKHQAKR